MLKSLSYRHAFRDYQSLEGSPPIDPVSFPCVLIRRTAEWISERHAFKAFDDSDRWYLGKQVYSSVKSKTTSNWHGSPWSEIPDLSYTGMLDSMLDSGPDPSLFIGGEDREIQTSTIDPFTGDVTLSSSYSPGYARDNRLTRPGSGGSSQRATVFVNPDGSQDTFNSIVFGGVDIQDILTDPYDDLYNPSVSNPGYIKSRPVDEDVSSSEVTQFSKQDKRKKAVQASFLHYSDDELIESASIVYDYERVDTETLFHRYYDEDWVRNANSEIVFSGDFCPVPITEDLALSILYEDVTDALYVSASEYRISASVPVSDKDEKYLIRWVIEASSSEWFNSELVVVPSGQAIAETKVHVLYVQEINVAYHLLSASAVKYDSFSGAITQRPDRDARPITFRHNFRDYHSLGKDEYLRIGFHVSLYAPVETRYPESFSTGSGWSLRASQVKYYEEDFSSSVGWGLGNGMIINSFDEEFSDSEGWNLKASFLESSYDESFDNSDGWDLFSS